MSRGLLDVLSEDVEIVGLCGRAGSGKDFIARNFLSQLGYRSVAFANGFKHKVVGMGATYQAVFFDKPPDVRKLLQEEGTERGRLEFGEDVWVRTMESFIHWCNTHWGMKKFVVTDVRFRNEMDWVKSVEGVVAFIDSDRAYTLNDEAKAHPSETEMLEVPRDYFDFIFKNDRDTTRGHLHRQVDEFVALVGKRAHAPSPQ